MMAEEEKPAVLIKHAYKRYGRGPYILKNMNMTIPQNKIYGLLGSSGCGKTTLLRTLVGAIDLDYGNIELAISSKKYIGFMPQDTALFDEFNIDETFQFYANLYKIPETKFQTMMQELKEVLDLPRQDQLCSTLSGGQARRVSIAVTLLHSPKLVILDEPTSGLDPLLSNLFWKYLNRLSVLGQTIVITTHYIEEARQANIVGLMRQGVLLAEDDPENLIRQYEVESLEDVFLCLCNQQTREPDTIEDSAGVDIKLKLEFKKPFKNESHDFSLFWSHTKAIMYKNMKWIQRNWPLFTLMTFVMSVLCMYESNVIIKEFPVTNIGVVNYSPNNCSTYDVNKILCDDNETQSLDLSCNFIEIWKEKVPEMKMILYDTAQEAFRDGKKRKLVTIFEIPFNFTRGIIERFSQGWSSDKDLLNTASIGISLDTTDYIAIFKINQDLREVLNAVFQNQLETCGYSADIGKLPPMNINKEAFLPEGEQYTPYDYSIHLSLSVMLSWTFIFPIFLLNLSLCLEKATGVYTRCLVGGVKIIEIFTAYAIQIFNLTLLNTALMCFIQFVIYQKPFGSFWLFYFTLNYLGLTAIMFGLFVIVLTSGLIEYAGITICLSVTIYIFSGFMWPIEAAVLPIIPYISSAILPNTLVLKSILTIVYKGATIFHKQVLYGLGICSAHIIFYVVAMYLIIKIRKSM